MLEVNEIFGPTIQGEGKRTGYPSVFIRFGKCNLRCPGFGVEYETPSGIKKCSCDSFHAVDTAFKKEWFSFQNAQDLLEEVHKYIPKNYKPDIVLTGGEPLLYWKNKEFQKLLKYFYDNYFQVTIETNASLDICIDKPYQKNILFSMSVKLSNSGEAIEKRINYKTLNHIIENCNESYLKFVIDKDFINKAQSEIEAILDKIPPVEVYLMPMGDTSVEISHNAQSVIEMAIKNGFKYSDRLHIRVWNNQRGV